MSRPSTQSTTRHASLLSSILSVPSLVREVQALPAPVLLRLVESVGLEDSSALLGLASSEQLSRMLDEDLWRPKGVDGAEELDDARLALWLCALSELGPAAAASSLAALDEEFLCLLLSRFLHAIELEALEFLRVNVPGDSWSDERLEKILETSECQEIGDVLVLARNGAPWEQLQPLLLALDDLDQRLCASLLHRLCAVTEARAEAEGGLYEVLSAGEMLGSDAAFGRELRRTRDGYLSLADAKAFRAWLDACSRPRLLALTGPDPVSRSYFRVYQGQALGANAFPGQPPPVVPAQPALLALLEPLGKETFREEAQPFPPDRERDSALARLLERLDPRRAARFHAELNFLAQAIALTEKEARGAAPLRAADAAKRVLERVEAGVRSCGPEAVRLSAIQLYGVGEKNGTS